MTTMSMYDGPATQRLDPDAVRHVPRAARPTGAGGLTLPVLALAALVSSPAIYQCLVRHAIPTHVMLERYVLIALGCLLVSEVGRRFLRADEAPEGPGSADLAAAGEPADALFPPATPSPLPGAPAAPADDVDPALALLAAEG
jgi:hypothetical protein